MLKRDTAPIQSSFAFHGFQCAVAWKYTAAHLSVLRHHSFAANKQNTLMRNWSSAVCVTALALTYVTQRLRHSLLAWILGKPAVQSARANTGRPVTSWGRGLKGKDWNPGDKTLTSGKDLVNSWQKYLAHICFMSYWFLERYFPESEFIPWYPFNVEGTLHLCTLHSFPPHAPIQPFD